MQSIESLQRMLALRAVTASTLQSQDERIAALRNQIKTELSALGIVLDAPHDCSAGGERKVYRYQNIGDALFDVLPLGQKTPFLLAEWSSL